MTNGEAINWIINLSADIGKSEHSDLWHYEQALSEIREMLESAEPRKGHWVEIGDEPYDEWECDMCGFVIDGSGCIDPLEYLNIYNFCPNCGARMSEGEE